MFCLERVEQKSPKIDSDGFKQVEGGSRAKVIAAESVQETKIENAFSALQSDDGMCCGG